MGRTPLGIWLVATGLAFTAQADGPSLNFNGVQPLEGSHPIAPLADASYKGSTEAFSPIFKTLKEQGLDPQFVDALSKDKALQFDEKFIHKNLLNFLTKDDYHVFLSKNSLKACRKFLTTFAEPLSHCEKKYGVPKEVIT